MTTLVGIFDDAVDVEKAAERLAEADFECTVYDETIVAQELGEVSAARPVLAPGSAPEVALGGEAPNLLPKPDQHTLAQAFKERLAKEYGLSGPEIDAYLRRSFTMESLSWWKRSPRVPRRPWGS